MIVVRELDRALVRRSPFACGQPDLDRWLREQAGQQDRRHNVRTVVAVDDEADRVVGYHATRAYEVAPARDGVRGAAGRRYPVPAVLIARMAVDLAYQGRGIGRLLLADALTRIAGVARQVGFELVVVHAVDEAAARFYAAHGFRRFEDEPRALYLTTRDLLASAREAATR